MNTSNPCFSLVRVFSLKKKQRCSPPFSSKTIGSIYPEDLSNTTYLRSRTHQTSSAVALFLMFSFFMFQHFEEPVPQCYIMLVFKAQWKLSRTVIVLQWALHSSRHKVIAVQKEKMTVNAEWTRHDRNTFRILCGGQTHPTALTHRTTFQRPSWRLTLCTTQLPTLFV